MQMSRHMHGISTNRRGKDGSYLLIITSKPPYVFLGRLLACPTRERLFFFHESSSSSSSSFFLLAPPKERKNQQQQNIIIHQPATAEQNPARPNFNKRLLIPKLQKGKGMEESDQQGESPPFWASDPPHPLLRPHPRPSSNLLLRPWFIFIIAPIISLLLLILIPYLSSFLGGIFHHKHPNNVKKTWDTLNLLLVVFAIICGILSRSSNGSHANSISNVEDSEDKLLQKSELSNEEDRQIPKWFDQYATDPTPLFNPVETAVAMSSSDSNSTRTTTLGRLRSSSSYPDLRKQESWVSDDVDVSSRRQSSQRRRRRRSCGEKDLEDSGLKTIQVDTFTLHHPKITTNSPPQQASSSSSLSRSAQKARWEFQTLPQKEEKQHFQAQEIKKSRQAPPPHPPPPPPPPCQRSEQEDGGGKRSSKGPKDIKSALSFLYPQRKKKRQENKSRLSSHDTSSIPSLPASNPIPPPTPPPPPPPPPASVFHHIFSHKKSSSKSRRIHSIPVPPPPPPPPPKKPMTARRAPMPERKEDLGSGSKSPLVPMPPPPPPPPFKMQALRFAVRGDFVRVQSGLSDSSDASDVIEIPNSETNTNVNGNVTVFCPSPDVNTKADTFIERFRAGLRLEKMNSLREKEEKMGSKTPDPAQADQEQQ